MTISAPSLAAFAISALLAAVPALGASLPPRDAPSVDCARGLTAYQQTVLPKVMRDCKECHGGGSSHAPAFATNDAVRGYYAILNRMDFSEPSRSIFVRRSGNGHCGSNQCNLASGAEMLALTQEWWNQGESDCRRNGKYATSEATLPEPLPVRAAGFLPSHSISRKSESPSKERGSRSKFSVSHRGERTGRPRPRCDSENRGSPRAKSRLPCAASGS
jgi:hypothetical protein